MAGVEAQRVLAALDHAVEGLKYALAQSLQIKLWMQPSFYIDGSIPV
jgi:hypothetical protein